MPVITRKEWLWTLAWTVFILIITSLPYLYGAMLSTPANQFGGFVLGVEDGNSYLAKMRLGAEGAWRFHLFYTSEPHQGAYLLLFHLLLGKLARLSGISLVVTYHLARLVCGFFLLLTIYYFIAFFTALRPVRRLAFWLIGLGSGLGWLVVALGWADRLGLPLDFYSPEAFVFHLLLALPHLALALTLLLWTVLLLLWAWERQQWRYACLAGFSLLAAATIAAFYVAIVAVVMGVGLLLRLWRRSHRLASWRLELAMLGLVLLMAMPVVLYNVYVFTTNPIFRLWAVQNRILSPPPLHYLLAFGPLIALAVVGGWREWRHDPDRSLVLIGWCLAVPLLVYLPFNLQRRLVLGVQLPLSILAALGWWRLSLRRQPDAAPGPVGASPAWRLGSMGLALLFSLSNLMILGGAFLTLRQTAPPLFQPGKLVEAADWLGQHVAADEVVLAAYETGNYLPTRMAGRVFVGHGPETIYADQKRAMVEQFFSAGQDDFRRRLGREYDITYLFYGPAERALGDFSPAGVPYLAEVYNNGSVSIYRLVADR